MTRVHREGTDKAAGSSDRDLWQRCRLADAQDDEGERFLDLAGFAEGRLDADESERVAALLAADPALTGDVAAATALAAGGTPPAAPEAVLARACAVRPDSAPADTAPADTAPSRPNAASETTAATLARVNPRGVVRFIPRARPPQNIAGLARWGSLAAAIALASWVGFAMGSNATLAFSDPNSSNQGSISDPSSSNQGFISELLDPSSGFLNNWTDNANT